jgi:hypothetical protein
MMISTSNHPAGESDRKPLILMLFVVLLDALITSIHVEA